MQKKASESSYGLQDIPGESVTSQHRTVVCKIGLEENSEKGGEKRTKDIVMETQK